MYERTVLDSYVFANLNYILVTMQSTLCTKGMGLNARLFFPSSVLPYAPYNLQILEPDWLWVFIVAGWESFV